MELRVEAEDAAAEQPVEQLVAPRADRERLGVRPGDVPERDDRRVAAAARGSSAAAARSDSPAPARPGRRCCASSTTASANLALTARYCSQSARAERRPHVRDVAQRPQALVGEAVVVARLLLGVSQMRRSWYAGSLGRHRDAVVRVDGLAVGAAAAVRDPGARARAHHRLERGDEAARRVLHARCRPSSRTWMYGSRLETTMTSLPRSSPRSDRAQRLAASSALASRRAAGTGARARASASRTSRAIGRSSGARAAPAGRRMPFAAQQRAQALHPAAPRELRDDDGDQRDASRRARRRSRTGSGASPRCAARRSSCRARQHEPIPAALPRAVDARTDVHHAFGRAQVLADVR